MDLDAIETLAGTTPAAGQAGVRPVDEDIRRTFGAIKGKFLRDFLAPAVEQRWRFAFEPVLARRLPLRNFGAVLFEAKRWLDYEVLVAPTDEERGTTGLFVVFVAWSRELATRIRSEPADICTQ